ncbi:unnamed protein product, partial [Brassica rapa subsp. trilocularis]
KKPDNPSQKAKDEERNHRKSIACKTRSSILSNRIKLPPEAHTEEQSRSEKLVQSERQRRTFETTTDPTCKERYQRS